MHTVQLALFYNVFTNNQHLFMSHSVMPAFLCYFTNSVVCCIIFFNFFHFFHCFTHCLVLHFLVTFCHILLRDVTAIHPYKILLLICYLS